MYLDKGRSDQDKLLIPNRVNSVSLFWVGVLFIGTSIYHIPMLIGSIFGSGMVISLVLIIFFGIVMRYSMWLLGQSVVNAQHDSEAMIWKTFSPKTAFIPCLIIFISCLSEIVNAYKYSYYFWNQFLHKFSDHPNIIISDYFFVTTVISCILLPGAIFRQDNEYFRVISFAKILIVFSLLILQIGFLIKNGIPTEHIKMFSPTLKSVVILFDRLTNYFTFIMFYLIIIGQMKNISLRRIRAFNRIGLLIVLISALVFGVVQYLTCGNSFEPGQLIFDAYPENSNEQITMIFFCFLQSAFFVPLFMIPAARSILGIIHPATPFPKEIWATTCFILAMFSIFIAKFDGSMAENATFISEFFKGMLTFVYPVLMYVVTMKMKPSVFHAVCGTLMGVLYLVYFAAHIVTFLYYS